MPKSEDPASGDPLLLAGPDLDEERAVLQEEASEAVLELRAQLAMTLPNHDPGSLRTLMTLSSPHYAPRLLFDSEMVLLYERLHRYWAAAQQPIPPLPPPAAAAAKEGNGTNSSAANGSTAAQASGSTSSTTSTTAIRRAALHRRRVLEDTVVVSIAGGYHDAFIPAQLCRLPYYLRPHARKHQTAFGDVAVASALKRVGFSVDHQALLWCRQIVRSVTNHVSDPSLICRRSC